MVALLSAIRRFWDTSIVEAATLTMLGVVVVVTGLRAFHVMGPGELDVLQRTSIPGKHALVRWLAG